MIQFNVIAISYEFSWCLHIDDLYLKNLHFLKIFMRSIRLNMVLYIAPDT